MRKQHGKKKKEKNGLKPATFLKTGNGSTRDLHVVTCRKISKAAIERDKTQLISGKEFSFSKYQNLCDNLLIANF